MFRLGCALVLALWLAAVLAGHTFNGWIHVLPAAVLLAIAARFVYVLISLD